MIKGIGIDIVDISRLSDRVADKILSKKELAEFEGYMKVNKERAFAFLGGRLAAKEAYLKAAAIGIYNGISLTELTVLKGENGNPYLKDRPSAFLSITHDAGVAVAVVIIY